MTDGIVGVLQFAIDGVSQQEDSVANNLANAQTPDYGDSEVSFESSLQQAIAAPGPAVATISTQPSDAAANSEGNNVDLDQELVESQKATLQFQSLSEALNAQFRLISGASGGSYS